MLLKIENKNVVTVREIVAFTHYPDEQSLHYQTWTNKGEGLHDVSLEDRDETVDVMTEDGQKYIWRKKSDPYLRGEIL